jgi:hypothetical protein
MKRTIIKICTTVILGVSVWDGGLILNNLVHNGLPKDNGPVYENPVGPRQEDPPRTGAGTNVSPLLIEEDEPGWDCHTMGNKICGSEFTLPPIGDDGMYVTTPCPWEAAQQGICEW